MSMKTSVVIADGTFSTNTAPLLGPIDEVVRKAAKIGYDAISATVDRPEAEYIRSFRSPALRLQLDSIHLHTNGELDFYPKILALEGLVGQVDISDVDRMAPDGTHFDFPLFVRALKELGYQDYLVSEFRAAPPANAAQAGLDYIRTLL